MSSSLLSYSYSKYPIDGLWGLMYHGLIYIVKPSQLVMMRWCALAYFFPLQDQPDLANRLRDIRMFTVWFRIVYAHLPFGAWWCRQLTQQFGIIHSGFFSHSPIAAHPSQPEFWSVLHTWNQWDIRSNMKTQSWRVNLLISFRRGMIS